jgi:hypothetical protein
VGDPGVHSSCCGPNTWKAAKGAPTVYFNGKKAHRKNDQTQHCGGMGTLVEGSSNVFVGNYSSGGQESSNRQELRVALFDHEGNYVKGVDFVAEGPATYSGKTEEKPVIFKDVPAGDYTIRFPSINVVKPGGNPKG